MQCSAGFGLVRSTLLPACVATCIRSRACKVDFCSKSSQERIDIDRTLDISRPRTFPGKWMHEGIDQRE